MSAMTPEQWQRIEAVLDAALDLSPAERAAYLATACGADVALRAEVERLLRACDDPSRVPTEPAAVFAAPLITAGAPRPEDDESPDTAAPQRIGPYRLLAEAGRGGMGTVYVAERDDDQYHKRVALKLVRRGLEGDERLVRRFVEERRILARLEHANIARLLDGGLTEQGLPWFVMEYVEGQPIDRACDERQLDVPARLRLFVRVCRAVAHAHAQGVVHRDLKPSNILVTADGEPKLLDFGIAKFVDGEARRGAAADGTLTRTGQRLLTPEYASPEQVRGEAVTEASDVYALGVLLYELLTGRRPHARPGRRAHELERAILDEEPTRPSSVVMRARGDDTGERASPERIGALRNTTPSRLQLRLRGDLDAIVLTALRKEPRRRYQTADALADDIQRHLDGRPAVARGDGAAYRAGKWLRRHRVSVGAALAGIAAGVALIVVAAPEATTRDASLPSVLGAEAPVLAVGRIADHRAPEAIAAHPLAEPLRDMLATNLARIEGVRVVSSARLLELLRQAGADTSAYLTAARHAGATQLLEGAIFQQDAELRVDLRRTTLATGAVAGAFTLRGPDVFALVDDGTARLAAELRAAAPEGSVAGVTTRSLTAYGLYTEGLRSYYLNDHAAALRLFDAALREDSLFALAAFHGARAAPTRAEQVTRMTRALTLSHRASERERLLIRGGWAHLNWEPELAGIADTLILRYPEETDGHLYRGIVRRLGGDFVGALASLRHVVAMDSLSFAQPAGRCIACEGMHNVVLAYLAADSLEAAEREARRWAQLRPQALLALELLWETLIAQRRFAQAAEVEQRLVALHPSVPAGVERAAVSAIVAGDFARADTVLRAQISSGNARTRRSALWYLTTSLRHQGRLEEALAMARRARAERDEQASAPPGSAPASAVPEAQVLFELGRVREAAALYDSIARWHLPEEPASARAQSRAWHMTHATVALAAAGEWQRLPARADSLARFGVQSNYGRVRNLHRFVRALELEHAGRLAEAEVELGRAVWSWPHGYTRINLTLARVQLAQGRPRDAIAALESALRGKIDASGFYVTQTELHELLGRAWDAAGEPRRAAPHHRYVVAAWSRGDAPFRARAAAAQRALAGPQALPAAQRAPNGRAGRERR